MLLSLRKRFTIVLSPTCIEVSEISRHGLRRQRSKPAVFPAALQTSEQAWQGALAALRHWLEKSEYASVDIDLIVSDSFARYALIPWFGEVKHQAEISLLSRIQFEELFGKAVADWEIQVDMLDYAKAGIGCALDKVLVKALEDLCFSHKVRLMSLQPYFMGAFNRARGYIGESALFAVVEFGQCVLVSIMNGAWHSIRSIRLGQSLEKELLVSIEREILLQGLDDKTAVFLHTLETLDSTLLQQGPRVITLLDTSRSPVEKVQ